MHDVDHTANGQLVDAKLACVNDRKAGQERGRTQERGEKERWRLHASESESERFAESKEKTQE